MDGGVGTGSFGRVREAVAGIFWKVKVPGVLARNPGKLVSMGWEELV